MKNFRELLGYVTISAGMALAASCFAMLSSLFLGANGDEIIIAIGIAGLLCILISLSISELASMFPSAPGVYVYLKAAFGESLSIFVVMLYLFLIACLASVESYVFASVYKEVIPGDIPTLYLSLGILVLVVVTNLFGLELSRSFQTFATIILIIAIYAIGIYALVNVSQLDLSETIMPTSDTVNWGKVAAAVGISIFLFTGFEWVTPLGKSPESYSRLVPLSMPIAILLLLGMYVVFTIALIYQIPAEKIAHTSIPQFLLTSKLFHQNANIIAAILSLLAITTSFNAGVMGASRLVYGMAREGSLPSWLARLNLRTFSPNNAILTLGAFAIISTVIIISLNGYIVAGMVGASIECIMYGLLVMALLRLRKKEPNKERPFRSGVPVFFKWIIAIVMPLFGIAALFSNPEYSLMPLIIFVGLVILAFLLSQWKRCKKVVS